MRATVPWVLKSQVLNHLGADSKATKEFGYAAPNKPKRTAEQKADAVKLALATREARGTMGKRRKLKIKGSLTTSSVPAAPATTVTTPTVVVHAAPVAAAPVSAPAVGAPAGATTPVVSTSNRAIVPAESSTLRSTPKSAGYLAAESRSHESDREERRTFAGG